jgi:hypothetical protein
VVRVRFILTQPSRIGAMIMTAAQLAHLGELAALGADGFAVSDPDAARMFGDSALRAETLSAELPHGETVAWIGTKMSALRFLDNWSAICFRLIRTSLERRCPTDTELTTPGA